MKILNQKGFSLLETLVAVTILVTATMGPLTLASKSIQIASLSRNQTVAYFLAEEAVEHIRNKIDENSFKGNDWLFGLANCLDKKKACRIDTTVPPLRGIQKCPGENKGGCPNLLYDDATGLYNHDVGVESPFKRSLFLTEIENDREVKLEVRVEWFHRESKREAAVTVHLFNWR